MSTEEQNKNLVIIGAGGHAKVVVSTAIENKKNISGFLDDNPALLHQRIGHYPVIGDTSFLMSIKGPAIFGLGNNLKRKQIAEYYLFFTEWETLIHPHAYVHPSVTLGKGTIVFAGAVIQPDAKIGDHCIINTGATIDHDCVIENYVHLAPGVHLAGNVYVGEGTFLGIGSAVIPNIRIGSWAQVAAGGVVVNDIFENKLVMGVPARERI